MADGGFYGTNVFTIKGAKNMKKRDDKQDTDLIKKHGRCNYCNGRGYLGAYTTGIDCCVCKGTGANRPKEEKKT